MQCYTCKVYGHKQNVCGLIHYDTGNEDWAEVENETVNLAINRDFISSLKLLKAKYRKRWFAAYINVNSIRHKIYDFSDIFTNMLIDVLCIAETKLDDNFFSGEFERFNYKMYWKDRRIGGSQGGDLLLYVRADLISSRKHEYDRTGIESIAIELCVQYTKWLIICTYWPDYSFKAVSELYGKCTGHGI